MIFIVQCHLEGGPDYQHIVRVRWKRTTSTAPYDGECGVDEMVESLLAGELIWADPERPQVPVSPVRIGRAGPHVFIESRTSSTANTLLALPRF